MFRTCSGDPCDHWLPDTLSRNAMFRASRASSAVLHQAVCVRRAFLLWRRTSSPERTSIIDGNGSNDRIRLLADSFAVSVYSYAVMSNHTAYRPPCRSEGSSGLADDEEGRASLAGGFPVERSRDASKAMSRKEYIHLGLRQRSGTHEGKSAPDWEA